MLPTFPDSILSRLPDASRKKAVALDNARQAAHAALTAVNARLTDAYKRRDVMEAEIEQQISELPANHRYEDEIEAMRAPVKVIEASIAELRAEAGRAEREFFSHDCVEKAAKWLSEPAQLARDLKHQKLPALKAGADHHALVDKARSRIDDLIEQIESVELAPAPADDLRQRIIFEVDRLAEAGRPAIDHRDPDSIAGAVIRAARVDTFSIWLNRDALVEKLTAEVQDAPHAMAEADKKKAIAKLTETLLDAERDEEAAVAAALAAGTIVTRRRSIDARALLELA